MTKLAGPRGSTLYVDSSHDTPLVWVSVIALTGSASDPNGQEGLTRHAFELARRGTESRTREQLDEAFDRMGASFSPLVTKDYAGFSGLCLSEKLDELIGLAREILSAPSFSQPEHEKLVRESRHYLDEVRDDDSDIAARFFTRLIAPGHPYARTSLGTSSSLETLSRNAARDTFTNLLTPANLVIGIAGDISADRARQVSELLVADLEVHEAPERGRPMPTQERESRCFLIDKPQRTQSQVLMGHLGPRYGSDDFVALMPVETAFGGMFTSRLMQEVRVKRGWSYGAYYRIGKALGEYFVQLSLAPSKAQTAPAIELATKLYTDLATSGVRGEELSFARRFLIGQNAFQLDTTRRRLGAEMESSLLEVPAGFTSSLPERLGACSEEDSWAATQRWIRPSSLCTVIVCTAAEIQSDIEALGLGPVQVLPYDSY